MSDKEEPKGAPRVPSWLVPLSWAALTSALVVETSQAESQTFNLAKRGLGIIQYPTAILGSHPTAMLLAYLASVALVVAVHVPLLRYGGRKAVPLLGMAGLAASAALFVLVTPLSLVLTAASLCVLILDAPPRIQGLYGSQAPNPISLGAVFSLALLLVVAEAGAARWVLGGFDGTPPFSGLSWYPAVVSAQLLGMAFPILPEIVLLFFFSWALRLGLGSLGLLSWPADGQMEAAGGRRVPILLLLAGVAIAAFVGAYPYLGAVNPSSTLVGVDVRSCYSHLLQNMPVSSPCGNIPVSYAGERAGALWVLEGLVALTGSVNVALEVAPALWGAFLAVATFLLVKEGTGDGLTAGVAALLTGVSLQVVAGIDAGLLADWLGLSLAFLFLAIVLRGMRTRKLWYLAPAFLVFVALLFTHPWTWSVTLGALGLFLNVDIAQAAASHRLRARKFELTLALSLVVLGAVADLGRAFLPAGSGFALSLSTVLPFLSPSNVPIVASNLVESLGTYLGGAQANPLWFLLGTVGALSIPSLQGRFGKLLLCWVGAVSIGVVLVGPPSNLLQSRMIYDTPIQIFAAIGVVAVVAGVRRGLQKEGSRAGAYAAAIVVASMVLLALGFALEYVGFLYT